MILLKKSPIPMPSGMKYKHFNLSHIERTLEFDFWLSQQFLFSLEESALESADIKGTPTPLLRLRMSRDEA
jgi:hypothetical protein